MRQPEDLEADSRAEQVYTKLRTARLNVKYYGRRLQTWERINFWLELSLAVFTSSAFTGLAFWTTPTGKIISGVFASVTSLTLVVKPFLPLTKRVKGYEAQLTAHQSLEADLMELRGLIELKRKFDKDHEAQFRRILATEKRLVAAPRPERSPCQGVLKRCESEVNRELPADDFFIPKEIRNGE
jgi:hypothetical protein